MWTPLILALGLTCPNLTGVYDNDPISGEQNDLLVITQKGCWELTHDSLQVTEDGRHRLSYSRRETLDGSHSADPENPTTDRVAYFAGNTFILIVTSASSAPIEYHWSPNSDGDLRLARGYRDAKGEFIQTQERTLPKL